MALVNREVLRQSGVDCPVLRVCWEATTSSVVLVLVGVGGRRTVVVVVVVVVECKERNGGPES